MEITVTFSDITHNPLTLSVAHNATILDIKKDIMNDTDIHVAKQQLSNGNNELSDNFMTAVQAGIQQGDVLHCTIVAAPPTVNVRRNRKSRRRQTRRRRSTRRH